ncbi:MAG: hypothetical protein RLZZ577_284 [Bacteroidota bacterium]
MRYKLMSDRYFMKRFWHFQALNRVGIRNSSDYSPFGVELDGRTVSLDGYRFGFQNQEKDNEVKGEGNSINYSFRMHDPRLGKFFAIDPLSKKYPHNSPYAFSENRVIDCGELEGLEIFYAADGTFLGQVGSNTQVMVVNDKIIKMKGGIKAVQKNLGQINNATTNSEVQNQHREAGERHLAWYLKNSKNTGLTQKEFQKQAATVYGESSAYKMSKVTDDLKKEMFATAYVHLNNKTAYGASSDKAKEFLNLTPEGRNSSEFKKLANAAIINAQTGGFDYSYGANMWDGKEQSLFPSSDNRGSTGAYELHMNTMGWSISDEHYKSWKKNVGDGFKAPQEKAAPINYGKYTNKGKIRLHSTAVYGETIFWKMK